MIFSRWRRGAVHRSKSFAARKLELLVEDSHGRLPDEVLLEYRLPDEPALHETLRHASLRDGHGRLRDVCLVSLPADRGPVWFRAIGGDDQTMAEYEMRVVLPPALESLKVKVTPPRYIARATTALPPGEGRIRGVVGTHVDFEARATKPLASSDLAIRGKTVAAMTVLPDRLTFRGGFDLAEAGTYAYSFKFKDSEGVDTVDPPRYEIEAIADQVPQVTIDAPAADATVTANAQIPVTVTAKDDWGLRDLQLRFHVGESSEANAPTVALATGLPRSEHHRASIVWPLGGLSVSEGMRIVFRAEATDWFDLGPAHVGRSLPRVLTIVSAKQKEAEIVSRQADLLRILERAEHVQSQTTDQTRDLDVQLEKAGRLRPADLDILKRVQSDQRRINEVLASPSDGAASAVPRCSTNCGKTTSQAPRRGKGSSDSTGNCRSSAVRTSPRSTITWRRPSRGPSWPFLRATTQRDPSKRRRSKRPVVNKESYSSRCDQCWAICRGGGTGRTSMNRCGNSSTFRKS